MLVILWVTYYCRSWLWSQIATCAYFRGREGQQNWTVILIFGVFLLEEAEFETNLAPLHGRGTRSDAAVLLVPLQTQRLKQIEMNREEQMGQVRSWEIIQSVRHWAISIFRRQAGAVAQHGSFWHSAHVRQFWNKSCIRCSVSKYSCLRECVCIWHGCL